MAEFDILGIGHAAYDTFGVLETMPAIDTAAWLDHLEIQGGGAASQAMVAASRLEMKTAFAGMVGDDREGMFLKNDLEKEGVNTEGLCVTEGARTSKAFVMVESSTGRRTIFVHPGSMPDLVFNDTIKKLILRSQIIHLDATVYDLAYEAAVFGKSQGIPVSLDGCETKAGQEKTSKLIGLTDILITNEGYPGLVTGIADRERALLELARMGPSVVIATQGKNGSWLVEQGQIRKFRTYEVPVTDTTGAGDVFHGAFLAAYLRKMTLPEAISYASACSSLNCMSLGGRKGIPNKETLGRYIANHGNLVYT
jgi:sugar/nucleoside kinase (ribokinase family)